MSIMEIRNIRYSYDDKRNVLKSVNAELEAGKMYAILGASGCGKTTLLSLLGGLDSPQSGQILYNDEDIEKTGLAAHRKNHVAFIFQSYNLIDYLTPRENVALTSNVPPMPILERMGLTEEESRRNVLKLSGGQQQRVAIARALASDASVILADEPTGNLDSKTSADVLGLLKRTSGEFNQTIVMITHNNEIAQLADRIVRIEDGQIVG